MPKGKAVLESWSGADFATKVLTSVVADGQEVVAASGKTFLVLFDRDTPEDRRLAGILAAIAAERADRLRALAVPAEEVLSRLQAWQQGRRAYDTFDFTRWPAVGVFRRGRLVTTFHPRHVFFIDRLQEREEREQLEIFLAKMVDYDPASVKEQKNLELEAEV